MFFKVFHSKNQQQLSHACKQLRAGAWVEDVWQQKLGRVVAVLVKDDYVIADTEVVLEDWPGMLKVSLMSSGSLQIEKVG